MKAQIALVLSVLLLAAGCTPDLPPAPAKVSQTPAPAKTEPPKPAKPDEKGPPAPKADPNDIPQRIYQVKDLQTITMKAPGGPLRIWVMNDAGKEQEGMMWLTEKQVADDQGMIFVFADADQRSFWMQNTLLPLDIIFLDPAGKALNIAEGKPKDETSVYSSGKSQFVIELKKGMSKKFGIHPGTVFDVPKSIKL